mgnify:FL=1
MASVGERTVRVSHGVCRQKADRIVNGDGDGRRVCGEMELLQSVLYQVVEIAILIFEYIGVAVILMAGIKGIVNYVRRSPSTRLDLAKGLATGLEFKLGSEILRTVVVREMQELIFVAGIIALRAVLTILIHWEIKNVD